MGSTDYRSEADALVAKTNYTALDLTLYPSQLDTRDNNENMRGFVNIGEGYKADYVYAEYINALGDAVMAIQRALGTNPMVPSWITAAGDIIASAENDTVGERLTVIESGAPFDKRYGGTGWSYTADRPTLSKHTHNGVGQNPDPISLTTDVTGKLPKTKLQLDAIGNSATAVTGADLYVSPANLISLADAVTDGLSRSKGGVVTGDVSLRGATQTRTHLSYLSDEMSTRTGVTRESDSAATAGITLQAFGTDAADLFSLPAADKQQLLFGRYVAAVRVKCSAVTHTPVLQISQGATTVTIHADEFGSANSYKQFYFVFDHNAATKATPVVFRKLATTAATIVAIDNIMVEPIHPAVLDR